MSSCAVTMCNNYKRITKGTDIKYYRFPKNADLRKKWEIACRRADKININNARICSAHFEPNCFLGPLLKHTLLNYSPASYRNLKSDAVPTLNLPVKKKVIIIRRNLRDLQNEKKSNFTLTISNGDKTNNSNNTTNNNQNIIDSREKTSKDVQGVPNTKDVQDVLNTKDVQDVLSTKDVQDVLSTKDVQDVLSTKDVQDVLNMKDVQDVLSTKDVQDMLSTKDVQDVRNTKEQSDSSQLQAKLSSLEQENVKLQLQLLSLKHINITLQENYTRCKRKCEHMEAAYGKIFTPGQIEKILQTKNKTIRWSPGDIASAISLRSISSQAYRYLRQKNYPLPALSTVRKWVASNSIKKLNKDI